MIVVLIELLKMFKKYSLWTQVACNRKYKLKSNLSQLHLSLENKLLSSNTYMGNAPQAICLFIFCDYRVITQEEENP